MKLLELFEGLNLPAINNIIRNTVANTLEHEAKNVIKDYNLSDEENAKDFFNNPPDIMYEFTDALSSNLTDVIQNHVYTEFRKYSVKKDIVDVKVWVDRNSRVSGEFKVLNPTKCRINIYLKNVNEMKEFSISTIEKFLYGESDINGFNELVNIISTIAIHEYTHLYQFLMLNLVNKKYRNPSLTYISKYPSNEPRKEKGVKYGKRGKHVYDASGDPVKVLKYYGSLHELDAFSSSAATEIYNDILKKVGNIQSVPNKKKFNQELSSVINDISKNGRYRSDTIYAINDIINVALKNNGVYEYFDKKSNKWKSEQFNKEELQRTWNRFLLMVMKKLNELKPSVSGKAEYSIDERLVKMIKGLDKTSDKLEAIIFDLFDKLPLTYSEVNASPLKNLTKDEYIEIRDSIENRTTSSIYIEPYINFINAYFVGDVYSSDEKEKLAIKLDTIFIKMVLKWLDRFINEEDN